MLRKRLESVGKKRFPGTEPHRRRIESVGIRGTTGTKRRANDAVGQTYDAIRGQFRDFASLRKHLARSDLARSMTRMTRNRGPLSGGGRGDRRLLGSTRGAPRTSG